MKHSGTLRIPVTHKILLLGVGLIISTLSFGQTNGSRRLMMFGQSAGLAGDTLFLDVNQDIAVQLMPFDDLVRVAVSHSPFIKYQNEVTNSLSAGYAVARTQILQNAAGYANYSTGNQAILSTDTRPGGLNNSNIGQIANGYRVGVDVRVSLYDLFGRKHQIRQAQANYQAALVQKEIIELQLRRDLITIYQDMITAQQVLKVRLLDEQASLTALRIAEAEVQKGKLTADLLANATNRYAQTKSITEQVKGDFLKNVHQFEALVGQPIQRLKRN